MHRPIGVAQRTASVSEDAIKRQSRAATGRMSYFDRLPEVIRQRVIDCPFPVAADGLYLGYEHSIRNGRTEASAIKWLLASIDHYVRVEAGGELLSNPEVRKLRKRHEIRHKLAPQVPEYASHG